MALAATPSTTPSDTVFCAVARHGSWAYDGAADKYMLSTRVAATFVDDDQLWGIKIASSMYMDTSLG